MKKIRLLALDIDGTILTREKKLTDRTKAAMEAAAAAGVAVVLVTGRPFYGVPEELLDVQGLQYVITSNGAVTTNLSDRSTLRSANLDPETALEIIAVPRELDLVYAAFLDGIGYCELEPFDRHLRLVHNLPIEAYIRRSRRVIDDMNGLIRNAVNGVENIWFIAHDWKERDKLSKQIRSQWKVRTVLTGKADVEVGALLADKGFALNALAERMHIHREQILAIGDNGNDLGMLQTAGIAVAMGNAEEVVKQMADIVTDSNEEDGAAKIMEQLTRIQ